MNNIPKKPRPDSGCMRCGRVYAGPVERTVMCFLPNEAGVPCGGRITWRGNPEDWTECPACGGTGTLRESGACPRCKGDGWLMGRHQA
jgi:DnaJ-class molecular chaperone